MLFFRPATPTGEQTPGNPLLPLDRYHNLSSIYSYLDHLAESYPRDVEVKTLGKTFEGRDIKMVKICKGGCGRR